MLKILALKTTEMSLHGPKYTNNADIIQVQLLQKTKFNDPQIFNILPQNQKDLPEVYICGL